MTKEDSYRTIVRVMGQGQFKVSDETVKSINEVDNAIVEILQNENKADDQEFETKISELIKTIVSKGQKLNDRELIESDIIVPDADISLDEARKVFKGEGIISEV